MLEQDHNAEARKSVFTLRDFISAGAERLHIDVVVGGAGLDHEVLEPVMNRPGLALTGFFGNFGWKRIQVIGKAEHAYLLSLADDERLERIKALFANKAYCLVFACGMPVPVGVCDAAAAAGVAVMRTTMLTREFFHRGTFVLGALAAPKAKLYGTTVEVAGLGVMIEGAPGLGKSETALGLVKHGNALVADDLTCIRKDEADNVLYASASSATRDYMEIRGIGFIHVPSVFGVTAVRGEKQLDLVVTLKQMKDVDGELDRAGEERRFRRLLGVDVPQIVIPVSAGRDLVNRVETAAQQFKLRNAGHDAATELDARLIARAEKAMEGETNGRTERNA